MWNKFKKVDARGRLPKIYSSPHYTSCGNVWLYDGANNGRAVPMVGVLPSGQIVDDFKTPECEPYFVVTFECEPVLDEFDVVTDGEKYSWIYNKAENDHSHLIGEECVLVEKPDGARTLTTRDARIIKVLIKAHLDGEAEDVA